MAGGSTVIASNGVGLPIDSLAQTLTYDGDFVATISVDYIDVNGNPTTYTQTITNNGTQITEVSQWTPEGP